MHLQCIIESVSLMLSLPVSGLQRPWPQKVDTEPVSYPAAAKYVNAYDSLHFLSSLGQQHYRRRHCSTILCKTKRTKQKKNNHQNTTHHTPLSVQLVMGQYILYINTCRYLFSSKNDAKQLASCLIYAPKLASAVYWLINKQVAQPQGALTVAYKKKKKQQSDKQ